MEPNSMPLFLSLRICSIAARRSFGLTAIRWPRGRRKVRGGAENGRARMPPRAKAVFFRGEFGWEASRARSAKNAHA